MEHVAGVLIPIVAIVMVFAVPIVAIIMDYRKRAVLAEERKAMIEKGIAPPPMEEEVGPFNKFRNPDAIRARSLRAGTILLALGIGLAVAFVMLQYVVTEFFLPRRMVGMLAVGSAVVGFLGLGNLVYYWLSAPKGLKDT